MKSLLVTTLLLSFAAAAAGAQAPEREIAHYRGDLFTVREGSRYTVFLVTAEGIVLVDPLSTETALWLKKELAARYPTLRVRYVLHTHHHFDRAEGSAVFNDTAELIGHQRFNEALAQSRLRRAAFLGTIDQQLIDSRDRNGDGETTPDEIYRRVREVETTFGSRRFLVIGGKGVEIIHVASQHAPDSAVIYFPSERVVFSVDHPQLGSGPFVFEMDTADVIGWTETVAPLPFDTLFSGSGAQATRDQVLQLRDYLGVLVDTVADGYERGVPVTTIQATTALDPFRATPHYGARQVQIADVHRTMTLFRAEILGAGMSHYVLRTGVFCENFDPCSGGGAVAAGTAAMQVSFGQFGVSTELTIPAQTWASRVSATYDEEFARKETRASFLLRFANKPGGQSIAALAGVSITAVDIEGLSRTKRDFPPAAGRRPLNVREYNFGITGGVDFVKTLSAAVSLVMPIRATAQLKSAVTPSIAPPTSRFDFQAGAGLSFRFIRRVN